MAILRWESSETIPSTRFRCARADLSSNPTSCKRVNYKYVWLRVEISILVIGDAGDIIGYGRKTPELSNELLHMK